MWQVKMASFAKLLLLAVGVICISGTVIAQDLLGCGGFVKSSASIDFSKIEVKFLSKSTGSVKYKTNCAPKNGYYLVPLYDKGEYVVKLEAPWGWRFDKSEVEVNVNGVDDPCTQQEDINFEFVGFSVTGKVVSAGSSSGPSGVKLEVLNHETGETYSGKSEPGGRFEFNEMLPGSYKLTASHPLWDVEQGPFDVDIVDDSIVFNRNIQIFGYDVTGQVTDGKSPVEGVNFLLRHVDGRNFYCIGSESLRKPHGQVASEALCATVSDSTGRFRFPSVAPGNYILRAQFMKNELRFGISPGEIPITVTQGSVAVKEHFKVEGFEVKGIVKTSEKGGGVRMAKVYVGGELRAHSDNDGNYHLSNMAVGKYTIQVEADGFEFDALEHTITLESPNIPDVFPSKYSVCGSVQVDLQFEEKLWKIFVSDSNSVISSAYTDSNGKFCFLLKPGKYSVRIEIPESELSKGLFFEPSTVDVVVKDLSQRNIKFSQFKTSISGEVVCIDQCPKSMAISLTRQADNTSRGPDKSEADGKILKFTFFSVYPGKYEVSISVPDWCWSASNVSIEVKPTGPSPSVKFVQSGYVMKITSSHTAVLDYKFAQDAKVSGQFELETGQNSFCLEKQGTYTLRVSDNSCHRFQQEDFVYNVNSPEPISLSATHHKILFTVEVPSKVTTNEVTLRIRSQFYSEIESEVVVSAHSILNDTSEEAVKILHFLHMARTSDRLEVTPLSNSLLFSPQKAFHDVSTNCPQEGGKFVGSHGMIVNGGVTPPLKGVSIELKTEGYAPVIVETDEKGLYTAGPFMTGVKLMIEASLDGYSFVRDENNSFFFIASALNSVSVKIIGENETPLSGALVSLSGTNFRSNSLTSSTGELNFTELTSGQYHIRPFYREYNFNPPSMDINMEGGSNTQVTFIGHRTAFSCIGRVKTLVGEGVGGITVKLSTVLSEGCGDLSESVVTDDAGGYRLSGLVPSCEYILSVHFDEKESLQAIPPEIRILGSKNDVTDVVFIVVPTLNKMEVSGFVSAKQEFISTLKVSLYDVASSSHPIHAVPLDAAGFFYLPPVTYKENVKYLVSLESHLSRSMYEYTLSTAEFSSFKGTKHINMEFEAKEIVVAKKSSYVLQLVVSVIFAGAFLMFGLSKVFGFTLSEAVGWLGQLSANSEDKTKKKHK